MQCENRELRYRTRCVTGDARTDRRCPHREYRTHQNALQYVKVAESRFMDVNRHAIPGFSSPDAAHALRPRSMRIACHHAANVHAGIRIARSPYRAPMTRRPHDFIAFFIGESRCARVAVCGPMMRRVRHRAARRGCASGCRRASRRTPDRTRHPPLHTPETHAHPWYGLG